MGRNKKQNHCEIHTHKKNKDITEENLKTRREFHRRKSRNRGKETTQIQIEKLSR